MSALGSLVVKLGLEYAEYTGGLSKTEQAALATAKKVQDTFDGMQRKVAATVGAIAGGLAAGFAVGAFRNLLAGVVETGARLDDLRMQSGETVEALSGLLAVGKYNDVGADQLGAMMQKLSSNLAGATEESKGTSKALQALGIDMDAFKRLSPAEQMQQIAQGLAKFEDGAGKSAVAIALLGKEGANALPFFNDLATVGELQAQVTTEQAAAAANLDDNIARLSATGEGWKKELVSGMVPALDLGAQALLDVMNGTGGMREEVKRLAADGSIREWTKNAITGLTYVADAAEYAWRALKSIGKGFGGLAAGLVLALQGDFRGAFNALKDSGQEMIDAFGGETMGARLRARMADIEATGQVAEAAKPKLDFSNVIDKTGMAAKEAKNPVDALIESIDKRTTQFAAELSAEEKLTEGEKLAIDVLEQLRSGKVKVTEAEAALIGKRLEALLLVEKELALSKEEAQARAAYRADRIKQAEATEQSAAALLQSNEELEREIELIGLTERQQVQVLRARNEAIILTKRATVAELERREALNAADMMQLVSLKSEIEQLERRNQLLEQRQVRQEEFTAWQSMWQSIDQTAHDVFVNVFEDGAGTFKRLGQTLKASLLDLLYQLTIKQWIINISANVGGGAGGAALQMASGGGRGLGSLLNLGSSVAGNWGAISGLFSGTMGIANAAGSIAANSIAATGITDGISALLATNGAYGTAAGAAAGGAAAGGAAAGSGGIAGALSAIPGWGWALAGVTAILGSVLGRKVEKRGQGIMGVLGEEGGVHDLDLMRKGGSIVGGPKWFVRDMGVSGMDQALQDTYKQQRDALIKMGEALGLAADGVENFTVQLGNDELGDKKVRGIRLDGLSDQEAQAKIAEALATANNEIAQQIIGSWERTTREVERAVYGGISDLALEDVTGVVRQTVEELRYIPSEFARDGERAIDTLTRLAGSLMGVNAVFENLGYTLFDASLAGGDMASQLVDLFGGLDGFNQATGAFFQNFYSAEEQRAAASRALQEQLDTVGLTLPDIDARDARQQWRDQAEALDRTTESGREAWAVLMRLSETFAALTQEGEAATEAMLQSVGITGTTIADTLRDTMLGRVAEADAGTAIADMVMGGIYNALAGGFAQQITDMMTQTIIAPVIQAALTGSSISAAVSQAAIDDMVAQATAAAAALNAVLSDASLRAALGSISGAISGVVGGVANVPARPYAPPARSYSSAAASYSNAADRVVSATDKVKDAWSDVADSLAGEVRRIRGLVAGEGTGGFVEAQALFAIATAQARAGDQEAAKRLPELSRHLLELAESNVRTSADLRYLQATTAASLQATAEGLAKKFGFTVPAFADGGDHLGGYAMVGERGPELAYMPPARIYTAAQTRAMLGQGDSAVRKQDGARDAAVQVARLDERMRNVERHTRRMESTLSDWTRNGVPVINKPDTRLTTEATP